MATGKISIYHPNAKGTGSAFQVEAREAKGGEDGSYVDGRVFLYFAPQSTVGTNEAGTRIPPTFNWEKKLIIRLNMFEVAEIISVFRGMAEDLSEGKGFFHKSAKGQTILTLEYKLEPRVGYWLNISRKAIEGETQKVGIFLSKTEAFALEMALTGAMPKIAFGI